MKRCSPTISLLTHAIVSNVWLLTDAQGQRFLVDSGVRAERWAIARGLEKAGVAKPGDLNAILLTHRHSDHAGNAAWLRERYQCPVLCHEADARVLRGEVPAEKLARGIGNLFDKICAECEDAFSVRMSIDETFGLGPWRHGFEIFAAFGHTQGSVLIYHAPSATLFSGDALLSGIPPLRVHESFGLAIDAYSHDTAACHAHVRAFLRDPPPLRQLCAGHGPFVGKRTQEKLAAFSAALASR